MPVDLSYLYSASPPLQQVFADHCTTRFGQFEVLSPSRRRYYVDESYRHDKFCTHPNTDTSTISVLKPCINSTISNNFEPNYLQCRLHSSRSSSQFVPDRPHMELKREKSDPGSKGKRVTFADAHGFTLECVKYMTENTNEPPNCDILSNVVKNLRLSSEVGLADYNIVEDSKPKLISDFEQPVANYLGFKQKLEKNNVLLENIILKDVTSINGTIKARNLAYEKKIAVRITFDCWKTSKDHDATYVKSIYGTDAFDTFQFNIAVPKSFDPVMQKVEFCIRYQTNKMEFWDNNEGQNYSITPNVYSPNTTKTEKKEQRNSRYGYSIPNTYSELPSPQFNTWLEWEDKGPFY